MQKSRIAQDDGAQNRADKNAASNAAGVAGNAASNAAYVANNASSTVANRGAHTANEASKNAELAASSSQGLPTISELAVGAALGCNMAWVSMSFKSMGMYSTTGGEDLLDMVYLVSIVAVVATLALVGVFNLLTQRMLDTRASKVALPLGITATTLLMPLGTFQDAFGLAIIMTAGILSGVFSGFYLVRLGLAYSKLSVRQIVLGAATATILSSLLFALVSLFQAFEACIFAASTPLVSAVLLEFGMHNIMLNPDAEPERRSMRTVTGSDNEKTAGGLTLSSPAAFDEIHDRRDWRVLIVRLSICSLLIGFTNECARTIYVQLGVVGIGGNAFSLLESITAFGATMGVVAIALLFLNAKTERLADNCYHIIVLLLLMGVIMLPVPTVFPKETTYLPVALNSAAYSCFGMLMWIIVTLASKHYSQLRVRTFAWVRATWAMGPLLGILLGRSLVHNTNLNIEAVLPVSIILALTILIASGFAFSENDLAHTMDIVPLERKQRFRAKCLAVIQDYGLSEREGEIMIMLAKGRNLPYIQDHLYLSKSTISTHRQHIYQKLDIHDQQELINMVEKAGEEL